MSELLETRLIHAGGGPDEKTGAVTVPIYQVSTYRQVGVGETLGYEYSRTGNPTRAALEELIAELENGSRGLAFASGMAAISAVFNLLSAGEHVVVGHDVYGGTYRVLEQVFKRQGIAFTPVDTRDPAAVRGAIRENTRVLFVETPSNPLMQVTDIRAMAKICREHGTLLVVDNTFMTPYYQRPLDLGADVVVHSATKYLGGHSDLVAGLVVARDAELGEKLHFIQNAVGGIAGPFDSWLLIRGIRTLGVRMRAHEANARDLADWLRTRPEVQRVHYPGLPDDPGHETMNAQATGYGGMLAFEMEDGQAAEQVVKAARLFTLAESLGAVESLISIPARMTHASIPPERRAELGITDGLIRVSVGLEHVEDLIADLEQAFAAAGGRA